MGFESGCWDLHNPRSFFHGGVEGCSCQESSKLISLQILLNNPDLQSLAETVSGPSGRWEAPCWSSDSRAKSYPRILKFTQSARSMHTRDRADDVLRLCGLLGALWRLMEDFSILYL